MFISIHSGIFQQENNIDMTIQEVFLKKSTICDSPTHSPMRVFLDAEAKKPSVLELSLNGYPVANCPIKYIFLENDMYEMQTKP